MKTLKYPKTIEACRDHQRSLWDIGDALVEETKDRKESLKDVAIELQENGLCTANGKLYTVKSLWDIRQIAESFSRSKRKSNLSFTHHREAKTPEALGIAIELAKKSDEILTCNFVRAALSSSHKRAVEARKSAFQAAKEKKAKAEQSEKDAETLEERRQAKKDKTEANKEYRKAKVLPKQNPTEDEALISLVASKVQVNSNKARALADETLKTLDERNAELSQAQIDMIVEAALIVAEKWRRVADKARACSTNKRSHIQAVS